MNCTICNNEHTEAVCPACSYNGECISNLETAIEYFKKIPNATPWQNKVLLFGEIDKASKPQKSDAKKSITLSISTAKFSLYKKIYNASFVYSDIFQENTFDDALRKIRNPYFNTGKKLFNSEDELQKHVLNNWNIYFSEWSFYKEYFEVDSNNEIDVLAKHKSKNEILIIENKLDVADEKALAQLLRYMGIIKNKYEDYKINGLLIACDINDTILDSLQFVNNVEIKVFNLTKGDLKLSKPIMSKSNINLLKKYFLNPHKE
jgi:hypothetical protein